LPASRTAGILAQPLRFSALRLLPKSVTARAEEVLGVLEKGEQGGALARLVDDLPLFSPDRRRAEPPRESAAEDLLLETRPDELTPREALDLVYRLKGWWRNKNGRPKPQTLCR
jgi:DNA mismatch repair ATPase MutS